MGVYLKQPTPIQEKICHCLGKPASSPRESSQHPHIGNQASSHVESAHSYIKSFINNFNGELSTVFQNLKTAIDVQSKHIHHTMGKERVRKLTDVSPPFKQIIGSISIKAIKIIEEQFQKLKDQPNLQPCSKNLMNCLRIPCLHEIEKLLNIKGYIGSEDFHPQWNLIYNPLEVGAILFLICVIVVMLKSCLTGH
ncbi:hypothetical protein O181_049896 [Austropuccinia psidii MF-1]|uniref:Uncharacterized protein n=1 Tax=Austropuccinia psidii MF-1 TaxID=1389203 RepID=A0A9Q3DT94_9BASI|nr:hypothetical protein [Austropuccinia psidii MF-1]